MYMYVLMTISSLVPRLPDFCASVNVEKYMAKIRLCYKDWPVLYHS